MGIKLFQYQRASLTSLEDFQVRYFKDLVELFLHSFSSSRCPVADQCLMEDYELVALLRKRASLLPKMSDRLNKEQLKIVSGEPAMCSPRRWQKFGVLYVTYTNSSLVNLYASGIGPDELFRLYYKQDPPCRRSSLSPWEENMSSLTNIDRWSHCWSREPPTH